LKGGLREIGVTTTGGNSGQWKQMVDNKLLKSKYYNFDKFERYGSFVREIAHWEPLWTVMALLM
jgi:hypothetical protein